MFHAFDLPADTSALRKRAVLAFAAASVTLLAPVVVVSLILDARPAAGPAPKQVDVSFRPPPPPPEPVVVKPPPPPMPRVAVVKPPPPAPVPVPTPVPQAAPPPAAAAMVAPKAVPAKAAPESDTAVEAITVAVGGTGDGTGSEVGTAAPADESAAPVVASAGSSGPINLPEDAEPPEPSEDNAQPEYPESARLTGQEARVVLKVVVQLDGTVGRVQVLKGEEPFVSAALAVVKTWKYEPATLEGAPISVFKIVNITFSLRN